LSRWNGFSLKAFRQNYPDGKTRNQLLVKLLFRYFEPQQGCIRIDGKDIRQLDVAEYRKRLAIVHQEVDLFNSTLLKICCTEILRQPLIKFRKPVKLLE
jgi:ABC-type transport system involved in cytochrome bd biosynthesis fused ATPase/permease subunit